MHWFRRAGSGGWLTGRGRRGECYIRGREGRSEAPAIPQWDAAAGFTTKQTKPTKARGPQIGQEAGRHEGRAVSRPAGQPCSWGVSLHADDVDAGAAARRPRMTAIPESRSVTASATMPHLLTVGAGVSVSIWNRATRTSEVHSDRPADGFVPGPPDGHPVAERRPW